MAAEKLLMYPSGFKALKLYSQIPTDGTGDFDVVRASVKTRVNKLRLIEEIAANVPSIDYTDGVCPVVLPENLSINLSTYSEDLTQWILSNATVTANNIIAPDGAMTADKFEFTVTDPLSRIRAGNQMAFSGDDFVASFFIKKGNSRYVTIKNENMTTIITVGFDLDLVTAETNGVIKEYKNGWFRLSITGSINGDADKTGPIYVILPNSLGSVTSVSGNYGYLWGGQAEDGTIASSYIKTENTSVVRLADVVTVAPPVGTISIVETIDDVDQTPIIIIPGTFTVSEGNINKIKMT